MAREAGRSAIPGLGSAGVAAAAGFGAGFLTGPAAPIVAPIAAIAAGLGSGYGLRRAQDSIVEQVAPESFMGAKSAQADEAAHPVATFVGSMLPLGKPSVTAPLKIAEAVGSKAGRAGIRKVAGTLLNKEASKELQATAKLRTPEGEQARGALESFQHGVGGLGNVGIMTGMNLAEGDSPTLAGLKGLGASAIRPWIGGAPKTTGPDLTSIRLEAEKNRQEKAAKEAADQQQAGLDTTAATLNEIVPNSPTAAEVARIAKEAAERAKGAEVSATTPPPDTTTTSTTPDETKTSSQQQGTETSTEAQDSLASGADSTTSTDTVGKSEIVDPVAAEVGEELGADVDKLKKRRPDLLRLKHNELQQRAFDAEKAGDVQELEALLNEAEVRAQKKRKSDDMVFFANNLRSAIRRLQGGGTEGVVNNQTTSRSVDIDDVDSVLDQQDQNNETETEEPTTTSTPVAAETTGQLTPVDENGVLPEVRDEAGEVTEESPLVSSADDQNPHGASAVTETPAVSQTEEVTSKAVAPAELHNLDLTESKAKTLDQRADEVADWYARMVVNAENGHGKRGVFDKDGNLVGLLEHVEKDFTPDVPYKLTKPVLELAVKKVQDKLPSLRRVAQKRGEEKAKAVAPVDTADNAGLQETQVAESQGDTEKVESSESQFTTDPNELEKRLQASGGKKIYIPEEIIDRDEELDPRIDFTYDKDAGAYYVKEVKAKTVEEGKWYYPSEESRQVYEPLHNLSPDATQAEKLEAASKVRAALENAKARGVSVKTPIDLEKMEVPSREIGTGRPLKTISLKNARWTSREFNVAEERELDNEGNDSENEEFDGGEREDDLGVERVMLPDGSKHFVDSNDIPDVIRKQIDANTPKEKPASQKALAKAMKDAGLPGGHTEEIRNWIEAGMPQDIPGAMAWVRRYKVEIPEIDRQTRENKKNAGSLDNSVGEGGTETAGSFVADSGAGKAEKVRADYGHEVAEDIIKMSQDDGVTFETRLGGLNALLSDRYFDQYFPNDDGTIYKEIASLRDQLENRLGKNARAISAGANDIAASYGPEEILAGHHLEGGPGERQLTRKAIDPRKVDEYFDSLEEDGVTPTHVSDARTELEKIASDRNASSFHNLLAQSLLKLLSKSGRLKQVPIKFYESLSHLNIAGDYNANRDEIRIDSSAPNLADTILEEVLHSLTADMPMTAELKSVFNRVRKAAVDAGITSSEQWKRASNLENPWQKGDEIHYAFANAHELFAWALKDPSVRKTMNDLKVPDTITGKLTSAWRLLKREFMKWLGFKVNRGSAFDVFVSHMLDHMARPRETNTLDSAPGDNVLSSDARTPERSKSSPTANEVLERIRAIRANRRSEAERANLKPPEPEPSKFGGTLEGVHSFLQDWSRSQGYDSASGEGSSRTGKTKVDGVAAMAALTKWADAHGLVLDPDQVKAQLRRLPSIDGGSEHNVWGSEKSGQVYKLTHPDEVGDGVVGGQSPNVIHYIQNLYEQNRLFNTGFEIVGIVGLDGEHPQLLIRQPWAKGKDANTKQIAKFMGDHKFVKDETGAWVQVDKGQLISVTDAVSSNLKAETVKGKTQVRPLDLQISRRPATAEEIEKYGDLDDSDDAPLASKIKPSTARENDEGQLTPENQAVHTPTELVSRTNDERSIIAVDYLNKVGLDKGYDQLKEMLSQPDAALPRDVIVRGFIEAEAAYQNVASELKSRGLSTLTYAEQLAYNRAQERNLEAHRFSERLLSEAGQTMVAGKGTMAMSAQDYVDQMLKGTLGGKVDELAEGKIDIKGLVDGIRKIKQKAAEVAIGKAAEVLGKAGIVDEDKIAGLTELLGGNDFTRDRLKSVLAQLMPEGTSPEAVEALTQQIAGLYNKAAQQVARAQLPKEVYAAYASKGAVKPLEMADKLSKYIELGRFDEDSIHQTLLETLGITGYDAEFVKALRDRAEHIQKLPVGSDQRNLQLQEFQGMIGNEILNQQLKGSNVDRFKAYAQIAPEIFRSAILTGPPTFLTHGFSGFLNVRLQGALFALGHTVEALKGGKSTSESLGFLKDFLDTMVLDDFTGGKGARGLPFLRESMRALRTGKIGIGLEQGVGTRGADQLANGVGGDSFAGKTFQKYARAISFGGRFMAAFDALNANSARELNQRFAMRMALLNAGDKGEPLAAKMKKVFAPTQEELQAARDELQKEVDAGFFGNMSDVDRKYSMANRIEQLHQEIALKNQGGDLLELLKSEKIDKLTKDWTLKGDARGLAGLISDGVIGSLNRRTKITQFMFPFVRIISNLMNNSLDYSPLGLLRARNASVSNLLLGENSRYAFSKIQPGSAEEYALGAKSVIGSGVAMAVTALFLKQLHDEEETGKKPDFMFYGAGPKDSAKRGQWIAAGAKPNSIKVGDVYIPYKAIPGVDLLGTMLGTLHDYLTYEAPEPKMKHGLVQQPKSLMTPDNLMRIAIGIAMSPLEHHFLSGAKNLIDILHDPQGPGVVHAAKRQIVGTASQFTNPQILRFLRNSDVFSANSSNELPNLDLNTAAGTSAQFIPFYYGYNSPSLNVLGDPIRHKLTDPLTDRWLVAGKTNPDPIITPLVNSGLFIPGPKKSIEIRVDGKGTLSTLSDAGDDAWREYVVYRGKFLKQVLSPTLIQKLIEMDRLQAQSILDGPSINHAASAYARSLVERDIVTGKIKVSKS